MVAGCGSSSPFDGTLLVVQARNGGLSDPTYTLTVEVSRTSDGTCPLSSSATITVNGLQAPWLQDCRAVDLPFGYSGDSFAVVVRDGDHQAQGQVSGLTPGNDPSLILTPSGQTTPSGNLSVAVPQALQGFTGSPIAEFAAPASRNDALTSPTVYGSTLNVPAPPNAGIFDLYVLLPNDTIGGGPVGTVSACAGFQRCAALAAPVIGPLRVTVVAAP